MIDIIENKKNNKELTKEEINFFVSEYTNGNIPDYQASALAMAIWFNKMTPAETANLTNAMANSGDVLDLSFFGNTTVDKHSSGGIGDKTTLIVAPIVASAGGTVAKMSGRGLGYTGGTIDKLESIPNLSTTMSPNDFINQAKNIGIVVAGQSGNMAPCDKKIYALRDVTATVDCMPLIASSIMSKKIASGAKNIVLDVKCGSGAFMKTRQDAVELANQMVQIGSACGKNVSAFVTNMQTPLGFAIGNSLEVVEAVKVLMGEQIDDLVELCIALSAKMISLSLRKDMPTSRQIALDMLSSGKAYNKFLQMVKAQGGDCSYIENPNKFGFDSCSANVCADSDGYIASIDSLSLGNASVLLGAGRSVKGEKIDNLAGIVLKAKIGAKVAKGDTVMVLYANDESKLQSALNLAKSSFKIVKNSVSKPKIILDTIN